MSISATKERVISDASPALPGCNVKAVVLENDPTGWVDTIDVGTTGPSWASVAMVIVTWFSRTPLKGNLTPGTVTFTALPSFIDATKVNISCSFEPCCSRCVLKPEPASMILFLSTVKPGSDKVILSPTAIDICGTKARDKRDKLKAFGDAPKVRFVDCMKEPIAGVFRIGTFGTGPKEASVEILRSNWLMFNPTFGMVI